ncbi:MAG: kelch repeat-containing protein [Ignavibacteriota bacterium]
MKNHLTSSLRSLGAIVFVIILAPLATFAQSGTWTTASSTGFSASVELTASVVGGKIYVIGGSDYATNAGQTDVRVFDPVSDTWTVLNTTGHIGLRTGATASVVNNKIYLIGGIEEDYTTPNDTVSVFDPALNTWTALTTSGTFTHRTAHAASVLNGKIYIFGGDTYDALSGAVSAVQVLDPATNAWSTVGNTPFDHRMYLGAVTVGNKIYFFGGYDESPKSAFTREILSYDPTTNVWDTVSVIAPRIGLENCELVNGQIYLIGGAANSFTIPNKVVTMFDPITHSIASVTTTGTQTARMLSASAVVGNRIYVIGGTTSDSPNGVTLNTNEYFVPSTSGVQTLLTDPSIQVSPNPTSGLVTVHGLPADISRVIVTNILGINVLDLPNPHSSEVTVDLSKLSAGSYVVKFVTRETAITKMIVRQ